jgi:hypothetical protein
MYLDNIIINKQKYLLKIKHIKVTQTSTYHLKIKMNKTITLFQVMLFLKINCFSLV